MSFTFDPTQGLIIVSARLVGPTGDTVVKLCLDTGATSTVINSKTLASLGYTEQHEAGRVEVLTASGKEVAPKVLLTRFRVLGRERDNFPVLTLKLPNETGIDGLLGLDFFRDGELVIDFTVGSIEFRT